MSKLLTATAIAIGYLGQEVPGKRFTEIFLRHGSIVLDEINNPSDELTAAKKAAEAMAEITAEAVDVRWNSDVVDRPRFDRLWFHYGTVCLLLEHLSNKFPTLRPFNMTIRRNGHRLGLRLHPF